jgi:maltose alpha-D-glucosyltransferase / alpha-amylase
LAAHVLDNEAAILARFKAVFEQRVASERIRFHGRLHLGHVLLTESNDTVILDFEGDPLLHISERRIKRCPLRDVVSMLLSFAYAAHSVSRQVFLDGNIATVDRTTLRSWTRFWYSHVSASFLRGYWKIAEGLAYMPDSRAHQQILLDNYLMERALLDVRQDINDNPDLAGMPFRIILHLLDAEAEWRIESDPS